MMWGFYGNGWWWMLIGSIWMVVFWGAIIWLVIWGVRQFSVGNTGSAHPEVTPLEIAQNRLARGEITLEEFEKLKQSLQ